MAHGVINRSADGFRKAVVIQWSRNRILLIHDIFPNPDDGGRPPYELWCQAQESGDFEVLGLFETLGMLRKRASPGAGA